MPLQTLPFCEKCNSRMIAQIEQKRLWCQVCGHARVDEEAQQIIREYLNEGGVELYTPEYVPSVRVNGPDGGQLALLRSAWSSMHRKDLKTARYLCERLLGEDGARIDALLLLAMMAEDEADKKGYLSSILSLDKTHERANYELAKMRGVIPDDAPFTTTTRTGETKEKIEEPVAADADLEECPMCGGQTLYVADDVVKCQACNYTPHSQSAAGFHETPLSEVMPPDGSYHSLRDALMQRKYGTNREWEIARRVLACQNCGAHITLSNTMMTQHCAFCDSQHILFQDSVDSFQEPDAILPARVEEREALSLVYNGLPANLRAAVGQTQTTGIFLPFWCFRGMLSASNSATQTNLTANTEDILVAGGNEPGQSILADLQPFHLEELRPYDQRYLANWSAELYAQDAIQASITANAFMKFITVQGLQGRVNRSSNFFARTDRNYTIRDALGAYTAQIVGTPDYRLLLLPVWMITLELGANRTHHAAVNAQTGEVVVTARVDSGTDYVAKAGLLR